LCLFFCARQSNPCPAASAREQGLRCRSMSADLAWAAAQCDQPIETEGDLSDPGKPVGASSASEISPSIERTRGTACRPSISWIDHSRLLVGYSGGPLPGADPERMENPMLSAQRGGRSPIDKQRCQMESVRGLIRKFDKAYQLTCMFHNNRWAIHTLGLTTDRS
jgi:hypothetical protein